MTENIGILETAKKTYQLMAADETLGNQAEHVKNLIDKLENDDMTVAIIGQFKRGKSTLANAILGDEILPVGIVPVTSAVTKIKYGKRSAEVHYNNGVIEAVGFDRLSEFISEQENEDNRLGVREVVLRTPSKFLKNGLTFVDTPGVGSFHTSNTEVAYHYMKESDAVIFLLSVDSPINQIEIDFLHGTREFAAKFYFAVNKVDTVSKKDLNLYMDYCNKLLCRMMETESVTMFAVSAETGEGVEELSDAVLRDCKKNSKQILETSTQKKLKDAITSSLAQLDFYWKAMNLSFTDLDKRFETLTEKLNEIRQEADVYEGQYEVKLNEIKMKLSQLVMEQFGMEYGYDIEDLSTDYLKMGREDFRKQVNALCDNLRSSLDKVLLYREENAYTVCHRINAINRLSRQLRKIRKELD